MSACIAILGAGNGAHAFAGDLALRGHDVRVYSRFAHELADLQRAGGVTCEGAISGFGAINLASTDLARVLAGAEFIFVVVPATVHAFMAEVCAPHLRDDQVVVLHPGRTGGALVFRRMLQRLQVRARVLVAEAQTLLYTCRVTGPARVRVSSVKDQVRLAAFPACDTAPVLERLGPLHPQFTAAADVLETGLNNIGAVFHPAATVLSASRIESGVPFEFYRDMTPGIARLIETLDAERLAVAAAYGATSQPARDWLACSYPGITGDTLLERLRSNAAYRGVAAPRAIDTRYIWEDVPTGLVPMAALGRIAGVPMPATEGLASVAGALLGQDFWNTGRNACQLGIDGLDVSGVIQHARGDA